jgi:sortase A
VKRSQFPGIRLPRRNRKAEIERETQTLPWQVRLQTNSQINPKQNRPSRGRIDWRGLGILVRTREFIDRALGVSGELLVSTGVFVLLFLGWHIWFNDIVAGAIQDRAAAALSKTWLNNGEAAVEFDRLTANSAGTRLGNEPPIALSGEPSVTFATMLVPRFGEKYNRAIAETVETETVLDDPDAGIGHYPTSNQLGQAGNFALAAHRTTYGAPFADIDQLRVGDRIYIETNQGWYVYRFRNMEYVWPTDTEVLNALPETNYTTTDRILTMTSCHPKMSSAERIIAYSVYESFVPRSNGKPFGIAAIQGAG